MKKYIMFAAALAVLAGCAKEEQKTLATEEKSQEEEISQEVVTDDGRRQIRLITNVEDPIARATLDLTNGFLWNTTSDATRFGLFTDADTYEPSTDVAIGLDKKAVVSVSVDANANKAYLLYGDSYGHVTNGIQPFSWFRLTPSQTQKDAGLLDDTHQKIILVSDPVSVSGGESEVSVNLNMLTSMICFNIYDSAGSSEKVQSVQFKADVCSPYSLINYCHVKYPFDGSASIYEIADSWNTGTVTLTNAYDLTSIEDKASAKGIFMGVMAGTVTGYTITVTTDAGAYKFVTDNSIEFKAGKVKPINIDIQKATPVFAVDRTSQNVTATTTSATINVTAFKAPWTAEVLSGAGASVSPVSGSRNGSVTVSFPENYSTTIENVYVIRVSTSASVPTKYYDITITQAVAGAAEPVFTYTLSTSGWNEGSIKESGRSLSYSAAAASGLTGQWIVIAENLAKDGVNYTPGAAYPAEDVSGLIRTVLGLSSSEYAAAAAWLNLDIEVLGAQWIVVVTGYSANDTGSPRSISGNILNSDGTTYTTYTIQQNA